MQPRFRLSFCTTEHILCIQNSGHKQVREAGLSRSTPGFVQQRHQLGSFRLGAEHFDAQIIEIRFDLIWFHISCPAGCPYGTSLESVRAGGADGGGEGR